MTVLYTKKETEQTPEQISNMNQLANYVFNLPENYLGFSMEFYSEDSQGRALKPCDSAERGTISCFLSHGPAAGIPAARLGKNTFENWTMYCLRVFGFRFTQPGGFFEMSSTTKKENAEWRWLFSPSWKYQDDTPQGAAKRWFWLRDHGLPCGWSKMLNGMEPLSYYKTVEMGES